MEKKNKSVGLIGAGLAMIFPGGVVLPPLMLVGFFTMFAGFVAGCDKEASE